MIAAPASRSASQSARSATTAARFVRIVAVARPRFARSWSSASAVRAASGNGGVPRNDGSGRSAGRPRASWPTLRARSRVVPGRGQDLGEVHDPDRRSPPATAARRCASGTTCRPRSGPRRPEPSTSSTLSRPIATDVSAFLTANVPPNPQHASDRGRSTRVRPSTAASSRRRAIADAEQAHRVAGRMERDPVREARPDVGHAEDVDEELAQLEDARRHRRRPGPAGRSERRAPRPARRRPDGGRGPSPRTSRTA